MADDTASNQPALTLAQRLLHHPHPQGPTATELFVERLPDGLTPELPLPSGATLLGCLVRWRHGRPLSLEAVLDAPGDPAALLAGYEPELTRRGWSSFEDFGPMHGGFVSGEQGEGRMYRHGADGPVLMVGVITIAEAQPSDVRLRLDFEFARRMPRGPHGLPPGGDLMPALHPPAGVAMTGQSGSGSDGRWTSETTVQTDRPVADLEAHFAAQLARAGWTRVAGAADDVIAWSAWQVPDQEESWRGLLFVLAPFGPTERSLTLRLERKEEPDGENGGYGNSFSITG
jgi:hypothetical protein